MSVGEAVAAARPDAIVHQMMGLSEAHAGKPNLRKPERFFAITNRLRCEGTDHLLAAAEATGVSNFVAQSAAIFSGIRQGGPVKTEEDPLDEVEGTQAINHLEDVVVKAGGAVLRYGGLYGPGATDDQVKLVRRRLYPLVGDGSGYFSWVYVGDAASATVLAMRFPRSQPTAPRHDRPADIRSAGTPDRSQPASTYGAPTRSRDRRDGDRITSVCSPWRSRPRGISDTRGSRMGRFGNVLRP